MVLDRLQETWTHWNTRRDPSGASRRTQSRRSTCCCANLEGATAIMACSMEGKLRSRVREGAVPGGAGTPVLGMYVRDCSSSIQYTCIDCEDGMITYSTVCRLDPPRHNTYNSTAPPVDRGRPSPSLPPPPTRAKLRPLMAAVGTWNNKQTKTVITTKCGNRALETPR